MKRKLYVLTVLTLSALTLCSCGKKADTDAASEETTQIANPWTDCSLEELKGRFEGMVCPSESEMENLTCRYDESDGIGEAVYKLASDTGELEFTLRMKKTDSLEDISGCYYEWTSTDDDEVLTFPEESMIYISDDLTVEVLNWYDTDTSICYSLSTQSDQDLDGFDIYGRAMEMYITDSEDSGDEASAADESTDAADTEAANTIEPLPSAYDLNNLEDCTIAVSFTTDDFNWMGGNLKVECYDELLYDAVDVSRLKVGDSIDVNGDIIEIKTLTDNDMGRVINEGLEDETDLVPGDGGTYLIWGFDDTYTMADLGHTEVVLSQDIVLNDCGEMPTDDTIEVTADKIKLYTENLEDSRKNFTCYDTTLLIENGEVTKITRSWRP